MRLTISPISKLLIGVLAGALSVGSIGVVAPAGATTPSSGATTRVGNHLTCAQAQKRLDHERRFEARHSKKLARLTASEAKAQAGGRTARVARLQRAIARERTMDARFMHSKLVTGLATMAPMITGTCHEAAPLAPSAGP